ncbi:hypothetical protein [Kerstersia sp.]|uniref:hypothetical protein n=1 Tax=Kerstersia sp. TaxID=1930783 RepID=UPI003F93A3E3
MSSSPPEDLSHYILIDRFSAWEIACLISGIDPANNPRHELLGNPLWGRVSTIEDAVEQAAKKANTLVIDALCRVTFDDIQLSLNEIFGPAPWDTANNQTGSMIGHDGDSEYIVFNALPTVQHRTSWHKRGSRPRQGHDDQDDSTKFFRTDIEVWLSRSGYRGSHYFIENEVVISTTTTEATNSPRNSSDELGTREKNNLLKMIAGLTAANYKSYTGERGTTTVTEVLRDFDALGIEGVKEDTLRKWLREAAAFLPRNP